MKMIANANGYTKSQFLILVILRITIGWHFLYEGLAKLMNPFWSAKIFLLDAKGFLSGLFVWMAENPSILKIIDQINIWGLMVIGLLLIAGFRVRPAALGGCILIGLYYLCQPSWPGFSYMLSMEGNTLLINKNVIELLALLVVYGFPTAHRFGIQRLFTKNEVIHRV